MRHPVYSRKPFACPLMPIPSAPVESDLPAELKPWFDRLTGYDASKDRLDRWLEMDRAAGRPPLPVAVADAKGNTLSHYLVCLTSGRYRCSKEALTWWLAHDGSLAPNQAGYTPFTMALLAGQTDVAPLMIGPGQSLRCLSQMAGRSIREYAGGSIIAEGNRLGALNFLLERGVPINALDEGAGPTAHLPLVAALLTHDAELVQWLLDRGADPYMGSPSACQALKEMPDGWDAAPLKERFLPQWSAHLLAEALSETLSDQPAPERRRARL